MLKANYTYHKLTFKQASGTSRGVLHTKDSWFIKIWEETSPEVNGIGECSIIPNLSYDNPLLLEDKIKEVCENISLFTQNYNDSLQDYPALRFAVETALLDLKNGGKRILYDSAFTANTEGILINGLLWMGDYDFMYRQLEEKIQQGFRCIKMKVGAINAEQEYKLLKEIRSNYPNHILRIDANGAFSPEECLNKLNEFHKIGIHSIEQPIKPKQWKTLAKLCKESKLPIALDEELIGILRKEEKENLLWEIKPHYIILKPSLLGGFKACEEWIELADKHSIGWWITSALESNIGLNAIAQWTASLKKTSLHQGLGTGSLYTNNIDSPLEIKGEKLWYNTKKEWQCF